MKTGSQNILPSPRYRNWLANQVVSRIVEAPEGIHATLISGLGDLALAMAQRPLSRWGGTSDTLARLINDKWSWPEATAIIEVGEDIGLLVPWFADRVRPIDARMMHWLGARRVLESGDPDELMDNRLNGSLFEVFAMAAGHAEADMGAGMVRLFYERHGPAEEQLELAAHLAAAAVAWGSGVEHEVRADLVRRAIDWTGLDASGWHMEVGTALLAAEAWDGVFTEEVIGGTIERYQEVRPALFDPETLGYPPLLATMEADLAILVAASEGDREQLDPLFEQLGPEYSDQVGRAVGRVLEPSEEKNALLMYAAQSSLALGDVAALAVLDGLVEPIAQAIGPMHTVFKQVLEGGEGSIMAARNACSAIAHWISCPETTAHLLARMVAAAHLDAPLRMYASAALAAHPRSLAMSRDTVLEALHSQFDRDDDAIARAAAVAAAMFLGTEEASAAAMSIGLVVDEVPVEMLGPALAYGLRVEPMLVTGLQHVWDTYPDEPSFMHASLKLLMEVAEDEKGAHDGGPFHRVPPLLPAVRGALVKFLLPLLGETDVPAVSAYAGGAIAWLHRGDEGTALTLKAVRDRAADPQLYEALTVALGGMGVVEVAGDLLAAEVVEGSPERSAAAARGLLVLLDTFDQTKLIEEHVPGLIARSEIPGDHQALQQHLLRVLMTLPLKP